MLSHSWLDTYMSDTATTISTKVHNLTPGDVVYSAYGDRLVVEVEHDAGFGTWVTFHNDERESFPVGYSVYRVVEA
jgi:hypothetical protein